MSGFSFHALHYIKQQHLCFFCFFFILPTVSANKQHLQPSVRAVIQLEKNWFYQVNLTIQRFYFTSSRAINLSHLLFIFTIYQLKVLICI